MSHRITIKNSLNQAYRKQKVPKEELEKFSDGLSQLLGKAKLAEESKESEENFKNLLADFLKSTYYKDRYEVNTFAKTDLVIHNDKSAKSSVGVLLEVKRPSNKADMITADSLNAKAMQELLLYYLRQKEAGNNDLKYCIITNVYEWYIFDAAEFYQEFTQDKSLKKAYTAWKNQQKESSSTDYFYRNIASDYITQKQANLHYTYVNLLDYASLLNTAKETHDKALVRLYKLFSPEHLLKQSFMNDSNSLDRKFYHELLHIIGLSEVKEKGKKLIERKPEKDRHPGAIIENTISVLRAENRLFRLRDRQQYGATEEEQYFAIALELAITWLNRILFLKLLEGQLINYHSNPDYAFLNRQKIHDFDDLNSLFFKVLAQQTPNRSENVMEYFGKVPYLNSSLFEPTELEYDTIFVSNLEDRFTLSTYRQTVLKDERGKVQKDIKLSTLDYLFQFLDAYDFSSEGGEEEQKENKTLINASVLGLIFEKINGYKDGSFFTPGFITMYMSRETIRKAVVQKFNVAFGIECETFEELRNFTSQRNYKPDFIQQANELINGLTICDPAVGSGHFLVSALNEMLAVKSELGVLADQDHRALPVQVSVVNDELMVTTQSGDFFTYQLTAAGNVLPDVQRIQQTLFHEKEQLIEGCLFGVDINPNSVKICRLRLWIELLKNAYYTRESNYTELETLPNIDINIKSGNSLLYRFDLQEDLSDVFKKQKFSLATYKDAVRAYKLTQSKEAKRELIAFIREIKEQFQTTLSNRDPLRKKMSKLRGEVELMENPSDLFGDVQIDQKVLKKKKKELAKLEQDKADIETNRLYESAFEWRFEFPEVLDEKGGFVGFDIVIGNPPYIRQEELGDFKAYLQQQYDVYAGTADLYVYFVEQGMKLLRSQGNFIFIIPNKWMRAGYGKALRKYVQRYALNQIIDFGDLPVFEEATTYPSIIQIKNGDPVQEFTAVNVATLNFTDGMADYVQQNQIVVLTDELADGGWTLTDRRVQQLLAKLRNNGVLLGEYVDGKIYRGVLTGLNEAFVIDEATRAQLIAQDPKSAEVIKPFLAGRDIKRYQQPQSDKYLIFTRRGIAIEEYPAILKYLTQYKDQLEPRPKDFDGKKWKGRKQGSYQWYEIQDAVDYYEEFEKKKLLLPDIALRAECMYDDRHFFCVNTAYIIPVDDLFLLGVINSHLTLFFYINITTSIRGGYLRFIRQYMEQIPIPKAATESKNEIIKLVKELLAIKQRNQKADTSALEAEIDQLVYQLYGLTAEEIEIIEGSSKA